MPFFASLWVQKVGLLRKISGNELNSRAGLCKKTTNSTEEQPRSLCPVFILNIGSAVEKCRQDEITTDSSFILGLPL